MHFRFLQAFWCEFPNTSADNGPMHGVCLIGHKNLIFASDTDWISYTITLPFIVIICSCLLQKFFGGCDLASRKIRLTSSAVLNY